jgi:hypothetical protein
MPIIATRVRFDELAHEVVSWLNGNIRHVLNWCWCCWYYCRIPGSRSTRSSSSSNFIDLITPVKNESTSDDKELNMNCSNADPVSSSSVIDLFTSSIKKEPTPVAKRSASARDTKSPASDVANAQIENKKKRKPGDNLSVEELPRNANRKRKPSSTQAITSFFKTKVEPKSALAARAARAAVVTPPSPVINANPKASFLFKPIMEGDIDASVKKVALTEKKGD